MLDNGQSAFAFGAYFGLLWQAKNLAHIEIVRDESNKLQQVAALVGVTVVMCLPATALVVVTNFSSQMHILTTMLLGSLIPIFYTGLMLVGFSEFVAAKLGFLEIRYTMRK